MLKRISLPIVFLLGCFIAEAAAEQPPGDPAAYPCNAFCRHYWLGWDDPRHPNAPPPAIDLHPLDAHVATLQPRPAPRPPAQAATPRPNAPADPLRSTVWARPVPAVTTLLPPRRPRGIGAVVLPRGDRLHPARPPEDHGALALRARHDLEPATRLAAAAPFAAPLGTGDHPAAPPSRLAPNFVLPALDAMPATPSPAVTLAAAVAETEPAPAASLVEPSRAVASAAAPPAIDSPAIDALAGLRPAELAVPAPRPAGLAVPVALPSAKAAVTPPRLALPPAFDVIASIMLAAPSAR